MTFMKPLFPFLIVCVIIIHEVNSRRFSTEIYTVWRVEILLLIEKEIGLSHVLSCGEDQLSQINSGLLGRADDGMQYPIEMSFGRNRWGEHLSEKQPYSIV